MESAGLAPVWAMSEGAMVAVVLAIAVVGVLLLFVEIVIPGFTVPGVMGIACLLGSGFLAWRNLSGAWFAAIMTLALLVSILMTFLFFRSRAGKSMVHKTDLGDAVGVDETEKRHIGREGVALTILRPTGVGIFGDDRLEVTSDGKFLAKGTRVRIVRWESTRLMVEPVEASETETDTNTNIANAGDGES